MHIYRFKVTFEDHDDFYREIEVQSDQTFEDFFMAIAENLKIDHGALSSFFICDHKFRKKFEISLIDMDPESDRQGKKTIGVMQNSKLNDYIDDPHQKLLLVYDYLNYWTFYMELLKILPANPQYKYPRFYKSEGETPRELLPLPVDVGPEVADDMDFTFEQVEGYDPEELEGFEDSDDFPGGGFHNVEGFDEEKPE
jgi:hypothetical protein